MSTSSVPSSTTPAANQANNTAAQAAANTTSASAMQSEFLKLLTTQLQNQDPTAPADTNQITQEMAQLGMVEQQTNTNSLLQQLISMLTASQTNNALSYIGKQVDATGNKVQLASGQAALVYNLPSGTSTATVSITNSAGQTVFSGAGPTVEGRNQVIWNGVNSITGLPMPDGVYTFSVTAKDATGNKLDTTTYTTGTVTAVESQDGTTNLSLGSLSVPVTSVQSVYTSGTNPGA